MNIESKIAEFAKANKISKAKLEAFAKEILGCVKPAGKPVSDESMRIRKALKDHMAELQGITFTTKEIAQKLQADQAYVGNNLRYLAEREGLFKIKGKKEKAKGCKGRKETLWAVAG